MRRTILLTLVTLLAMTTAHDASAQRRGGAGHGFNRGGRGFSRSRVGFGYAYLPSDYDSGYAPQPAVFIQPPPVQPLLQPLLLVQPPARPVEPDRPMVTEYKWPAAKADSSPSDSEPQVFAIVLKSGTTLSALTVFASDDGLHYVDPDERHLLISMSEVDRAATLKLNRARNLNLYLPAAQ